MSSFISSTSRTYHPATKRRRQRARTDCILLLRLRFPFKLRPKRLEPGPVQPSSQSRARCHHVATFANAGRVGLHVGQRQPLWRRRIEFLGCSGKFLNFFSRRGEAESALPTSARLGTNTKLTRFAHLFFAPQLQTQGLRSLRQALAKQGGGGVALDAMLKDDRFAKGDQSLMSPSIRKRDTFSATGK